MSEHDEQAALFNWAGYESGRYPELRLMYAIPNGGHRRKATAISLKKEGVKAGVPDICLPVARGGYHGLYIEMKFGRNRPTPDQERWLEELRETGHRTAVCYGWEEASNLILDYLKG